MKNYMKLFLISVLSLTLATGFTSCLNDDGYSLGNQWVDIVSVQKTDDDTYFFTKDDGKTLWVAAPADINWKPESGRAIINYTILSDAKDGYDHYIRLNQYSDILTKKIVYIAPDDRVKQDSIGYDPIKVYSIWEGGGYLNFNFGYDTGEKNAHMVNLVSAKPDLSVSDDVVKLEFRHNVNGDTPPMYSVKGYVCFDLKPYKIAGRDTVTFEISWKDFGGETKTLRVEYKCPIDSSSEE
jgi:hypothetical protein